MAGPESAPGEAPAAQPAPQEAGAQPKDNVNKEEKASRFKRFLDYVDNWYDVNMNPVREKRWKRNAIIGTSIAAVAVVSAVSIYCLRHHSDVDLSAPAISGSYTPAELQSKGIDEIALYEAGYDMNGDGIPERRSVFARPGDPKAYKLLGRFPDQIYVAEITGVRRYTDPDKSTNITPESAADLKKTNVDTIYRGVGEKADLEYRIISPKNQVQITEK